MTIAIKAASHFGTPYVAAAAEACSRLVGVCRELRCTHSTYILTRQGFLGLGDEVWFHRFPSPAFGFPFHPLPFTHLFFSSFLSCLSSLHVLSSHPFLSFAYTSVLALGCTRTSTVHLYRFQVAQVLIMRFGLFFVPVHLVPLFIATTHAFVPSVLSFMSSSSCPRCAHNAHLFVT